MNDGMNDDQTDDEIQPLPENWVEMFSDESEDHATEDSADQPAGSDAIIPTDWEIQRGERDKPQPEDASPEMSGEQADQLAEGYEEQHLQQDEISSDELDIQRGERGMRRAGEPAGTVFSNPEGSFGEISEPPPNVHEEWSSIESAIQRGERDLQSNGKVTDTGSTEQGDQSVIADPQETPGTAEANPAEPDIPPLSGGILQTSIPDYPESAFIQAPAGRNPRKVALILSGGGARGAFQVGAEKYAREAKGFQWDIIAGVSVGAMNGAMLAMHRYARLLELWDGISNDKVYTGGFNLVSLVKILFGAKSFYGNQPLIKLMQQEFEAGRVLDDLHVGAVSLISGEYVQFTRESLELPKAILASASIPVVWPPVDVSPDHPAMVDGGVRNITPVGDVLELEPDEIVIINCGKEQPPVKPHAADNVLTIGMRALDIMQNEIFVNDMKEFLRINVLVKEAEQHGCILHHPKTGRPLKYYPCQVIEPAGELGDVLDFSRQSVQAALKAGVMRACEVLGRPGTSQL